MKKSILYYMDDEVKNLNIKGSKFSFDDEQLKNKNITFTRSKLGYEELPQTKGYKNVIIESDTGTGKTTSFKHYMKQNPDLKFLSITSRVSLCMEHYRTFKDYGLECQHYKQKMKPNVSTIVQLESLKKVIRRDKKSESIINQDNISNYVVFIDEINSLIKHLISSKTILTSNNTYQDLMADIMLILKHSKKVFVMDATISESVKIFMNFWSEKTVFIKNHYKNNENINALELDNYNQLLKKLKKRKKYMVCCDSASNAKALYKDLSKFHKNIKLIVADSNKTTDESINLDEHDRIIFSPKIIYGLDSQMERDVFCYFCCRSIDCIQMYQQLSRTRNINQLYFFFTQKPKFKRKYKFLDEVKKERFDNESFLKERYELLGKDKITSLIDDLRNYQEFEDDIMKEDIFKFFLNLLDEKGFNITLSKSKKKTDNKNKKALKNEYNEEVYNFETNKNNKFLELPEDVAAKNIELLSDDYLVLKHINFTQWIEKRSLYFEDVIKGSSYKYFSEDIIKNRLFKMRTLEKWINSIDSEKDFIKSNICIKDLNQKEILTEYKMIYKRSKLKKFNIMTIINKLIEDLFPKDSYNRIKMRNKEGIQTFKLILNDEMVEYHKKLQSYRKNEPSPDDIDFKEEEEDDDDDDDEYEEENEDGEEEPDD